MRGVPAPGPSPSVGAPNSSLAQQTLDSKLAVLALRVTAMCDRDRSRRDDQPRGPLVPAHPPRESRSCRHVLGQEVRAGTPNPLQARSQYFGLCGPYGVGHGDAVLLGAIRMKGRGWVPEPSAVWVQRASADPCASLVVTVPEQTAPEPREVDGRLEVWRKGNPLGLGQKRQILRHGKYLSKSS